MQEPKRVTLGRTLLCAALAGGLGWGIRGQYGHETGAMLAGVLVGFVLIRSFCRQFSVCAAARVVAFLAIGVSFGGSETYGQTVGLTHDLRFVGNVEALRWGLLGLFVKGGLWIGFAGAFLGMALSGKRYTVRELLLLFWGLTLLLFVGWFFLNEPFDPEKRLLPKLYFSGSWYWQPDNTTLKPRLERWGGLLYALLGLLAWAGWGKKDRLVVMLGLWGVLAGGLGFSLGQCVQAYHAWHVEALKASLPGWLEPHINWWNAMEITFGTIWGLVLALGVWCNRHRILPPETDEPELSESATWMLAAVQVLCLIAWQFLDFSAFESFADLALTMGVLPMILAAGTRLGPFLVALPLVAVTIAGKTVKELCYEHAELAPALGWPLLLLLPLGLTLYAACTLATTDTPTLARRGLLLAVWLYFSLNFAFFRLPWPWAAWTSRTPSGIYYTLAALVLTLAVSSRGRRPQ